jgi:hypothetical protein
VDTEHSLAVDTVYAISDHKQMHAKAMDMVLADYVDPDAINALADVTESLWTLTFLVDGIEVSVDSRGDISCTDVN